jgi:hypothetical protein
MGKLEHSRRTLSGSKEILRHRTLDKLLILREEANATNLGKSLARLLLSALQLEQPGPGVQNGSTGGCFQQAPGCSFLNGSRDGRPGMPPLP